MADILHAVQAVLANDSGVSALVSTRIYPDHLPQKTPTYPAIVITLIDETSVIHMGGMSGLGDARIQVDCYANTRLGAAALSDAVRLSLSDYTGTSQSVVVRHTYPGTGFAAYEPPIDGTDLALYRHSRDYRAVYVEATS